MDLQFRVDTELCIGCGQCVDDCPYMVLAMDENVPMVVAARAGACIRCQHCLAICPEAALSIHGVDPADCVSIQGHFPDVARLDTLMRGRRSVRRYRDENVDLVLIRRLLDTAWQAPTGVNSRQVLFSVVDDKKSMAVLRQEVMASLASAVREGKLPPERQLFSGFVRLWEEKGVDIIFRGAPHLLIASAPRNCPCPEPDCLIALSYFELLAQCYGLGTVWDGLARWTLSEFLPEFMERLGIPSDHLVGYAMVFGYPAVEYQRTVDHGPASINRVVFG
ncbi:MAG: nitroreductase family protein [Proteobacteria bacterium]|nr:4Fe-4S dicluster domain-containing protein [Desulfobulbaceae bacterium]MBU4153440.1 nitroreductase family protein [Pseudomonadota bacterium]